MLRRAALFAPGLALGLTLAGCGVEFKPASEVRSLRVLAVQKDKPYARPGEAVSLQLLWHDVAGAIEAARPPPAIAWLAACENPPGDLYERCFEQFQDLSELSDRVLLPTPGASVENDRFSFTTSADIITSRPPPKDPKLPAYGLTYVFFAVCAGSLDLAPGENFPLLCYEERDGVVGFGASDVRLGAESFVVGYSAVFAYETVANANPKLGGIEFNGALLAAEPAAAGSPEATRALVLPARDFCIGGGCPAVVPEDEFASCPEALTLDACDGCNKVSLKPSIDPSNAELDTIASSLGGANLSEQMWVNYYTTLGEMDDDVRLLNDAGLGWSDSYDTEYSPGADPGVGYLWAVAHDNRGGAEWLRVRVCVR